jgi:hypothetical protein
MTADTPEALMTPNTLMRRQAWRVTDQVVRGVARWRSRTDRGDVPGWVMITVMTAGLVAMLTAVAGPQLRDMLDSALSSVTT